MKESTWLKERDQGWFPLGALILLCLIPHAVNRWLDTGWAVVANSFAVCLWFVIRPWRFGLIPQEKREIWFRTGSVAVVGFLIIALANYWR